MNDKELFDMLDNFGIWTEEQTELQLTNPNQDTNKPLSNEGTLNTKDAIDEGASSLLSLDDARNKRKIRSASLFSGRSAYLVTSAAALLLIAGFGYTLFNQTATEREEDLVGAAAAPSTFDELACATSPTSESSSPNDQTATDAPDHVFDIEQFVSETCVRTVFTLGAPTFGPAEQVPTDFETELVRHDGFVTLDLPEDWGVVMVNEYIANPDLAVYETANTISVSDFGFAGSLTRNNKNVERVDRGLPDEVADMYPDRPTPQEGDIEINSQRGDSELYVNHGTENYSLAVLSNPARIVVDSILEPGEIPNPQDVGTTVFGIHVSNIDATSDTCCVTVKGVGGFVNGTGIFEVLDSSGEAVEAEWYQTLPAGRNSLLSRTTTELTFTAGVAGSLWERFEFEIQGLEPGQYTLVEKGDEKLDMPFTVAE